MLDVNNIVNVVQRNLNDGAGTGTIAEKLNQLMPSIYIMIATLGAFFVLIIILTKFLYNPVKKMIKDRQNFIQKNIDDSIKAKANAMSFEQEARDKLNDSKLVALDIINKSKLDAEVLKNQYIDQGKLEAKRIITEAKEDIKTKKIAIEKDSHDEIVNVAIQISEKLISAKISRKEAEQYLNDYLGEKDDVKTK